MNWRNHYQKAITFSFDDGNEQDLHLLELLQQYGLKATFHVNTGLNSQNGSWIYQNKLEVHRLDLETYASCYQGQEVAVHGKLHQNLTTLSPKELEEEIGEDVAAITKIFGEKPVGISYAYGVYNETVLQMVQKYGLRYGRGVNDTHAFSEQFNLLEFQPTCRYDDPQIFALADRFLQMHPKEPQIFCIWGHSYEMDGKNNWSDLECFFNKISGKSDIFYGTCREVLLR